MSPRIADFGRPVWHRAASGAPAPAAHPMNVTADPLTVLPTGHDLVRRCCRVRARCRGTPENRARRGRSRRRTRLDSDQGRWQVLASPGAAAASMALFACLQAARRRHPSCTALAGGELGQSLDGCSPLPSGDSTYVTGRTACCTCTACEHSATPCCSAPHRGRRDPQLHTTRRRGRGRIRRGSCYWIGGPGSTASPRACATARRRRCGCAICAHLRAVP